MRYLTERKGGATEAGIFYYEDPSDRENVVVIFPTKSGGLTVAVSEEQAVDSYNDSFECSMHLSKERAERLRDRLCEWFPKT